MEWRRHVVWETAGWDSCVDWALHKPLVPLSEQARIQLHLVHRASPRHKMASAPEGSLFKMALSLKGPFINRPFLNWQRSDAEPISSALLLPGFKEGKGLS